MRRLVRIFFMTVLIGGIVCVGLVLFYYLQANNLLFFATGTKEKAFLNTTWSMSPNEIRRATGMPLLFSRNERLWERYRELFGPHVMDKKRFQEMEQRDFYLWGHIAEVTYHFFDHKLYEYFVSITSGTALLDSHKAIMTALEARAGVAQPDKKERPEILYAYKWESSRERIQYRVSRDSDTAYTAGIRVTHVASMSEIERIVREEQNTYFSK